MKRTFDLEAWRLFCAVIERGGVNAAAESLEMEPSGASRVLRALERDLGGPLFFRSTRPVTLTPLGREAYPKAKDILARHKAMLSELAGGADSMSGLIRVACPSSIGAYSMTTLLIEFQNMYPDIEFDLISIRGFADTLQADSEGQPVHVAIGYGDGPTEGKRASYVGIMEFIACCSPRYINRHGFISGPEDCPGHIGLAWSTVRNRERKICRKGIEKVVLWKHLIHLPNLQSVYNACLLGGGCVMDLPLIHCWKALAEGSLVEVMPGWRAKSVGCYVYTPDEYLKTRRVLVFSEWIAEKQKAFLASLGSRTA